MPLTPVDIHNKEFRKSFRGYDVDEVNDFLDQIIKDFELITREKLEMEQQIEELQSELENILERDPFLQPNHQLPGSISRYQNTESMRTLPPSAAALSSMEQSIHKSIRVAQEVSDEVRLNAKKEAELIVQEAEKNADRMINEALQKTRVIQSEFMDLKQKSNIYRIRFRSLVQSHLEILDNSDWDSLSEIESSLAENEQLKEEVINDYYNESTNFEEVEEKEFVNSELNYDNKVIEKNKNKLKEEQKHVLEEVAAGYANEDTEVDLPREVKRTPRKVRRKALF